MPNDYTTLLNLIRTKTDARMLESEIEVILGSLKDTQMLTLTLSKSVRFSTAQLITKKLSELGGDRYKLQEFLSKFKVALQNLKTLKLTLAFEPTEQIITNIHAWINQNFGAGIVLEIEQDKSIIGGAIVTFEGLYKDYTVRRRLEDKFKPASQGQALEASGTK